MAERGLTPMLARLDSLCSVTFYVHRCFYKMFIPAGRLFTIILLMLTSLAYGSQTTNPTASATSLSGLIPSCAADCIEEFIISDYPKGACSEWDLDCLCRTNTTSGYTLGEAAFRCSLSLCSMKTVFSADFDANRIKSHAKDCNDDDDSDGAIYLQLQFGLQHWVRV
ncbi:hypothetical protein CBS115989_2941 [Aspergillus niger]|nr:hypothetical protein CBS115989_2941 [Aspergillus niger]KAI2857015.1 hypothetical protein CBS11232_3450 [Aspergillus niger]KAI2877683.1 hypothetical protein CBS115988_3810 [Aspergillus niger]KAI2885713.1 hypothetical protein CBS13152_7327 [Aspergillus niger]KAI2936923.1 hypothetical protein CBS147321_8137 [Aspergillus niger]